MRPTPRISVVVPAFNHERFIGEALESVRRQTFEDFEAVIVDDGSTDGTAEIAQAVARKDPRFRVHRQANAGSHAAINRAIALAQGDWIAILNSDDRFAPGRLARLLDEAQQGALFIVTDVCLIDAQGIEIVDPNHWWLKSAALFRSRAIALGAVDGLIY